METGPADVLKEISPPPAASMSEMSALDRVKVIEPID